MAQSFDDMEILPVLVMISGRAERLWPLNHERAPHDTKGSSPEFSEAVSRRLFRHSLSL